MNTHTLDLRGLKCPQPTLKMTIAIHEYQKGDMIEVMADCPTFEDDLKSWSQRTRKTVLWVREENGHKRCQVQL